MIVANSTLRCPHARHRYDEQVRRGGRGGCEPRRRIWDNCDHKRLHWWYNTIYGSSFAGDASPEASLEAAIATTVERVLSRLL